MFSSIFLLSTREKLIASAVELSEIVFFVTTLTIFLFLRSSLFVILCASVEKFKLFFLIFYEDLKYPKD